MLKKSLLYCRQNRLYMLSKAIETGTILLIDQVQLRDNRNYFLIRDINPNRHEGGYFYLLVLLGFDFVS